MKNLLLPVLFLLSMNIEASSRTRAIFVPVLPVNDHWICFQTDSLPQAAALVATGPEKTALVPTLDMPPRYLVFQMIRADYVYVPPLPDYAYETTPDPVEAAARYGLKMTMNKGIVSVGGTWIVWWGK